MLVFANLSASRRIILLSLAVGLALIGAMAAATLWFAQSIDEGYLERERKLVQAQMLHQVSRQLSDQGSIAIWDDAVLAIRSSDDAWLAANLIEWQSEYYNYERVYLISSAGTPLRAAKGGLHTAAVDFWTESTDLISYITEARQSLRVRSESESAESLGRADFVRSSDGGVAIVTVWPVIPASSAVRQPLSDENYLVAINAADQQLSDEIGSHLSVDGLLFSRENSGLTAGASMPLVDRHGQTLGHLSWHPRRPIAEALVEAGPFVILILLLGGGIVAALLRRLNLTSVALEQSEARASRLAYTDHLSNLENRTSLTIKLKDAIRRLRDTNAPFALFYIDLDKFKQVNDGMGHAAGDEVIRQTGMRLQQILRKADVAARLGGDEFAVIVSDVSDRSMVIAIGRRIVETLSEPFEISGGQAVVGASVGGFVVTDRDCDEDAVLFNADTALYLAKTSGRGRFELYESPQPTIGADQHREVS